MGCACRKKSQQRKVNPAPIRMGSPLADPVAPLSSAQPLNALPNVQERTPVYQRLRDGKRVRR